MDSNCFYIFIEPAPILSFLCLFVYLHSFRNGSDIYHRGSFVIREKERQREKSSVLFTVSRKCLRHRRKKVRT